MHFFLLYVFCLSIVIVFIIITFSDTQRLGSPTKFEINNKLYGFIRENIFNLKPFRVNLGSFTLALKMEAPYCSEKFTFTYKSARCRILEDSNLSSKFITQPPYCKSLPIYQWWSCLFVSSAMNVSSSSSRCSVPVLSATHIRSVRENPTSCFTHSRQ